MTYERDFGAEEPDAEEPTVADEPKLFVDMTELGGGCRLVLAGSVDIATVAALRRGLSDAVDHRGDIEVDLYQVDFMDSQGLNALCTARAALGPGRTIRVVDSSPQVRRLLEVTGLDEVFGIDRLNPPRDRLIPG